MHVRMPRLSWGGAGLESGLTSKGRQVPACAATPARVLLWPRGTLVSGRPLRKPPAPPPRTPGWPAQSRLAHGSRCRRSFPPHRPERDGTSRRAKATERRFPRLRTRRIGAALPCGCSPRGRRGAVPCRGSSPAKGSCRSSPRRVASRKRPLVGLCSAEGADHHCLHPPPGKQSGPCPPPPCPTETSGRSPWSAGCCSRGLASPTQARPPNGTLPCASEPSSPAQG